MTNTTDRPEVLFLDTGPWFGGAQRSLSTLVQGVREHGVTPLVAASDHTPGGLLETCRDAEIATQPIGARHWRKTPGGVFRFGVDVCLLRRTFRKLLARRPVVCVHANTARAAFLASFAVPRSMPLVVHSRDLAEPVVVRRRVGARASAIIAISHTVARKWAASEPKVSVIYNGLDIDALRHASPREAFPRADNGLRLVLVADMVPWKRHDMFLRAVGLVHTRRPGIRAAVVGRATTREGRRWLASLKEGVHALRIPQLVEFITDADNAVPWIAGSDVLVSTAESEPFGRTIVEALALGKPVVAVGGSGPEEIIGDCPAGTVVGGETAEVADAIFAWRDASRRAGIADAAVERARQFGAVRMVEQVAQVVLQACRSAP